MPFLIWLVFLALIFTRISSQKKSEAAKKGHQSTASAAARKQPQIVRQVQQVKKAPAKASAPVQPARPIQPAAEMLPPLQASQPAVEAVHDHDHPGSMGDLHDEGFDPCHDDDLHPALDPALAPIMNTPAPAPGLSFSWTKDDLVKGFVMGEILGRPRR